MAWDEDGLHRWLARRRAPSELSGSPGHDAAVLRARGGRPVVCVDQCIEGVHYEARTPASMAGAKAAARALSDLAATAARPRALLLALGAPARAQDAHLRALITAVDREGRRHGAPLVAGDLAHSSGPLTMAVTALGELPGRARPPGRDRARAGQSLVLTGPVGGSGLGRHLAIRPRLAEGAWLYARGATALMDVSDGLAWDVFRLARAAGVRIDLHDVPVHRDAVRAARRSGRAPREHALHDGEDHELLATLDAPALARVLREAPRHCPGLAVIGAVRAGQGLCIETDGELRPWDGAGGWRG
jgi:thiamine-monophosphate kinase